MLYKLLSLISLGSPGAIVLPPFIYATSTVENWEKNWVARVEGNNEVLICDKGGQSEIGYRILVETNSGDHERVDLRAEHIPGYKQKTYGIHLRFQDSSENFMISDENKEDQKDHGGGGVYCKSTAKWNKEGVKIDGNDVGSHRRLGNSWGGDLNYLAKYIKRVDKSECSVYYMSVVCKLQWNNNNIESEKSSIQVDKSKLTISGSLPNLVYRPF